MRTFFRLLVFILSGFYGYWAVKDGIAGEWDVAAFEGVLALVLFVIGSQRKADHD